MKNICQGMENIVALVGRRAQTMFATRAIRGQTVFIKDNINEMKIDIDISYLSKGTYFLKGTFGINSVSEKIILN